MAHDTTPTGSTTRLVQENKKKTRCMSFCPCLSTSLVVLSLAFSMGNILRLPRMVIQYGGGAYLIIYMGMCLILGFPLAFLEVVLGQFCQQGTTKLWRAVPLLKGVGYVKVVTSFLLAVYYPAMMAVTLFMALWTIKRPIPFLECNETMSNQNPGDSCLKETILTSPVDDPTDSQGIDGPIWFGLLVTLMFLLWAFIMLCICRGAKSVRMSSVIIVFLSLGCLIALLVNDFYNGFLYDVKNATHSPADNTSVSVRHYPANMGYMKLLDIDWSYTLKFDTWYYALIQLFFSTQLGFGNITTCAGNIYSKSNAFWTSLFYVFFNMIVGVSFVVIIYMWCGDVEMNDAKFQLNNFTVPELFVNTLIYDESGKHQNVLIWGLVAYFLIILAGFASMTALVYTIVIALAVETKNKWRSWLITAFVCTVTFVTGILVLLPSDWQLIHLLDFNMIGRMVTMTTALELIGFLWIYGVRNICNDFEFVLGHKLSPMWIIIWCIAPVFLVTMEVCSIFFLKNIERPQWVSITGWCIYGFMWLIIFVCAIWQVLLQVDYNFGQKFISSLKASRKWGPVDPMYRHGWVQWRDQYQATGERDFTLKRRGTRDYTHSVKTEHRYNTMSLQRTNPSYIVQLSQGLDKKPEHVGWRKGDNISIEHKHRIKS